MLSLTVLTRVIIQLAARLSFDKFSGDRHPLRILMGFSNSIENQFDELLAQLLREFTGCAENWIEPRADGIIAAGNTNVVGDFEAPVSQSLINTMRGRVIAGKNGRDGIVSGQHRLGAQISALRIVFGVDAALERRQTRLLHCVAIALKAAGKPWQASVAHKANAAVAQLDQVSSRILATLNIIGKHHVVVLQSCCSPITLLPRTAKGMPFSPNSWIRFIELVPARMTARITS